MNRAGPVPGRLPPGGQRSGVSLPLVLALLIVAIALGIALVGDSHLLATGNVAFQRLRLDYELESLLEVAFNTLKERPLAQWDDDDLARLGVVGRQALAGGQIDLLVNRVGSEAVDLQLSAHGKYGEREVRARATFTPLPAGAEPDGIPMGEWRLALLPPPS